MVELEYTILPQEGLRARLDRVLQARGVSLRQMASESHMSASTVSRFLKYDCVDLDFDNQVKISAWIREPKVESTGDAVTDIAVAILHDTTLEPEAKKSLIQVMTTAYQQCVQAQ